jgi:hypothetical protein
MRKLITTIAFLVQVDTSVAIAKTAGSRNPAAPPSTNSGQQLLPDAVPENTALNRMINGIFRDCQILALTSHRLDDQRRCRMSTTPSSPARACM